MFRIEPNTPVELKRGVLAFAAPDEPCDEDARARVHALFARLGTVVTVPEPLMRVAGAIGGVGPGLLGAAGRGAGRRRGAARDAAPRSPRRS